MINCQQYLKMMSNNYYIRKSKNHDIGEMESLTVQVYIMYDFLRININCLFMDL